MSLESEILFLKRQLAESRQEAEEHCGRADEAERLRDRMADELAACKSRLAFYDTAPRVDLERRSSPAPPELQGQVEDLSAAADMALAEAIEENHRVGNSPPTVAHRK